MMSSRISHQPSSLPKYGKLIDKMNNMSMAIKVHHYSHGDVNNDALAKVKSNLPTPTWESVVDLLWEAIKELQNDRYSPVKY